MPVLPSLLETPPSRPGNGLVNTALGPLEIRPPALAHSPRRKASCTAVLSASRSPRGTAAPSGRNHSNGPTAVQPSLLTAACVAASGPFHLGLGRFHSSAQASASLPAGPGQLPAHLAHDVITCITAASAGSSLCDGP